MRWLTHFYDFWFKWTPTKGIGIHPTKAWLSLLVISKMQSGREDTLEERYAIKFCFKLWKMSQKCFRLHFDLLPWTQHRCLSGIRDSRVDRGSVRDDERCGRSKEVNKPETFGQRVRVRVTMLRFLKEFRKRFRRKRPALFKSAQWHFQQDNAPVHNSILVTDYLTKIGIKTVTHRPKRPDLAPCDFWLFLKLRGCRYETVEELKDVVTKVINTLTNDDFHGAFQKLLKRHNKAHCSLRRLLRRGLEFHECTINKSAHTKKGWKII